MKMKKVLAVVMAAAMTLSLAACGGGDDKQTNNNTPASGNDSNTSANADTNSNADNNDADTPSDSQGEEIVIKVFSNLPDRTSGQGLVEQQLFDAYMSENPNVRIVVEALDDEAYKTKFRAYATGSEMPDLVNIWAQPGFIDEVIDAGLLAELNPADYDDYGFPNGALDGCMRDGKLYGLTRNTDIMCFFYNAKMFEDNGWSVPTTYNELIALGETISAAGVIPVSMDGGDKWPIAIWITDLMAKIDGSGVMQKTHDAIAAGDFSDPTFVKAATLLQQAANSGLFQTGFETSDYGTAMNLFTNGQAAMFYMGSWEMSMATSEDIPAEIRDNIRVFTMPVVEDGAGSATDIAAWNGGAYAVTANAAQREEAIKLLNYMFRPDGWTKIAWENGVCMSAQDFSAYQTGNETELQKQLMEVFKNATNVSGTPINDMGTSAFKTTCEDATQELAISKITPQEYLDKLAAACN